MPTFKSLHQRVRAQVLRKTRLLEIDLVLRNISRHMPAFPSPPQILEFGAGNCYQAKRLATLGLMTASDTESLKTRSEELDGIWFVVASLDSAPFKSGTFDLIFSNHVLEHLSDLKASLAEARRIAKPQALFAFTVPTCFWLLLAQPAELGWRIAGLRRTLRNQGLSAITGLFRLTGHGEYMSFGSALQAFRQESWTRLLEVNGFQILERVPLLAYAPSELLLPPSRSLVHFGLYSSTLFIMRTSESRDS